MEFLAAENKCGQNLLRLVSRGSAIIAELLRLANNVPDVFFGPEKVLDQERRKYCDILFDFTYRNEPEDYEKKINASTALLDLDEEFKENHTDILERFYQLFESILKYQTDMTKFVEDVNGGYYLQHSLEDILDDVNGRQLLCECVYLYGEMLLLVEAYIPGPARERILIANYRYFGERSALVNIDSLCKLFRNTNYLKGGSRPKKYPENYFARFPPDAELVRLIIGRLNTDDVYLMAQSFPNPDHRSTRLATQASMLYVILYFSPDLLNKEKAKMREFVDKYFNDNFVIATYMGHVVDLTIEWSGYPAAKAALDNIFSAKYIQDLNERNVSTMRKSQQEMDHFLTEGLITQDFLFANMTPLLNCVRTTNIAIRWRLLHRRAGSEGTKRLVLDSFSSSDIVTYLLSLSQLEYTLKNMFQELLNDKEIAWTDGRSQAAERFDELSEYFTGEKALTKVKRDDNLRSWFARLAEQTRSLDLQEDHATSTGRKIQGVVSALEDVEQFEAIDTSVQIKTYLNEIKDIFRVMIRTVNIKREIIHILDNVSDLSYGWVVMGDYLSVLHERIRRDPASVVLLRATFLKLASILDVPLVRITSIDSPDAESVAEYYSGELVEFVRQVLEIIPISVFKILGSIRDIQVQKMKPIPIRLEAKDLKDFAQLDLRYELAKATHQVSIFTEGVLVMERTLLGVIQVDPRQILEEGLRRVLVREVTSALHSNISFKELSRQEINKNLTTLAQTLNGLKKSIEYLQDYIDTAGLKIYQQEFGRVINYYVEQEANRYLKKKTFDSASRFQSKAIPIPRFDSGSAADPSGGTNFMGRVMSALLFLTDSTATVYAPECSAWFSHSAPDQKQVATVEICGIRTFSLIERSLGVIGMRGLDRLLAFRTVYELNQFLKFYKTDIHPFRTLLDQIREALFPEFRTPPNATKLYASGMTKLKNLMLPLLILIRRLGQSQLIRRQIAHSLQFGCQLEAHLLYQALDTFNHGLLNDIRKHYKQPDKFPYPEKENPLLFETASLMESCGMDDPLHKIYITSQPLEGLPILLFMFLLTYLPRLEYDSNFGALVRKKAAFPLDGVPLVVGLSCLLKQFHPSATKALMSYLGQFVRTNIQVALQDIDGKASDAKIGEIPQEVLNTLIFMDQLCHYSSIPRTVIHAFIPPFIFDAIKVSPTPTGK